MQGALRGISRTRIRTDTGFTLTTSDPIAPAVRLDHLISDAQPSPFLPWFTASAFDTTDRTANRWWALRLVNRGRFIYRAVAYSMSVDGATGGFDIQGGLRVYTSAVTATQGNTFTANGHACIRSPEDRFNADSPSSGAIHPDFAFDYGYYASQPFPGHIGFWTGLPDFYADSPSTYIFAVQNGWHELGPRPIPVGPGEQLVIARGSQAASFVESEGSFSILFEELDDQ